MRWFFWFLPLLSAFVLAVSLEHEKLGPLSFLGLLPLLLFIKKSQNKKITFFGGWLFGFVFFGLNLRWFFSTFSFNWVNVPGNVSVAPVAGFVWFILSFGMGLSFAFFAVLVFALSTGRKYDLFFIPSIWILCELLKAELFMLISWGPGGSLGPHWMMGSLGLSLVDTSAIFWSRFFGVYGMGFLVVFVNILVFRFFKEIKVDSKVVKYFLFLVLVVFLLFALPQFLFKVERSGEVLDAALLQANSRLGVLKNEIVMDLWEGVEKVEDFSGPDIVVLPEDFGLPSDFFQNKDQNGLAVASLKEESPGSSYPKSKIIYFDQKGRVVSEQEKNFLIPAGEFLPLSVNLFIRALGRGEMIKPFLQNRGLSPGDAIEKPVSFKDTKIVTLLCSGVLSPSLYRNQVNMGAEVLINSASLTIFNENHSFFHQLKNMARFQAIANARPFLQSANGAPAFYIDENGETIKEGDFPKAMFVLADVYPVKTKTAFTRFGNWPLYLAVFFVFLSFIRNRKYRS